MLVIVAVFSLVALIMLAAVVDLGGLRQEKKEVTLSTDAAALAGAVLADIEDPDLVTSGATPVDCEQVRTDVLAPNGEAFENVQQAVDDYLDRNGGSSELDCKVVRVGLRRGYVLVSADDIVDFAFGPAIGQTSGSVQGVSVAAIQEQPGGGGLRPVAVCADASTLDGPVTNVRELIDNSGGVPNGGLPRELVFAIDKVNGEDGCGIAQGNFGQLDLNGGSNPASCNNPDGFCWQMENGYSGGVTNPVNGNPGNAFNPATGAIDSVIDSGIRFYVPVYDKAVPQGANAEFNVTHYLESIFIDYCLDNNPNGCAIDDADGDPMRWFKWKVLRIVDFTTIGPPSATPPRICAVSNDNGVISANCEGAALPGGVSPLPEPPPPPPCDVAEISPIDDSATLTNGNPKVTEQAATYDVRFTDIGECSDLNFRVYRLQGNTETTGAMSADAPAGDVVRITLSEGYQIAQGTYQVQALEGTSVLQPAGTLTVSQK